MIRRSEIMSVRARDGSLHPFDAGKISAAIVAAMSEAGSGGRELADELTDAVVHFLESARDERGTGAPVSLEEIHDMVEKVLMETGHRRIARAYVLRRERRARLRERRLAPGVDPAVETESAEVADPPEVENRYDRGTESWSRTRIARALVEEADLDLDEADAVARAVEGRVRRSGVETISTHLIRELVDSELFERGDEASLRRQASIALPRYDLEQILFRGGDPARGVYASDPRRVGHLLGEMILRQYVLGEVLPAQVRDAIAAGEIHLHRLDAPLSILRSAVVARPPRVEDDAERTRGRAVRGGDGAERGVFETIADELRRLVRGVTEEVAVYGLAPALHLERRAAGETADESREPERVAHRLVALADEYRTVRDVLSGAPQLAIHIPCTPHFVSVPTTGSELFPRREVEREECALFLLETVRHALEDSVGRRALARCTVKLDVTRETFAERRFRDALVALLALAPREMPIAFRIGAPRARRRRPDLATGAELRADLLGVELDAGSANELGANLLAGKVTLNLPGLAIRALQEGGDIRPQLARAADTALDAIRHRAELQRRLAIHRDGPLAGIVDALPLFEDSRTGSVHRGLEATHHAVGLLGLHEAVRLLTGQPLHGDARGLRAGLEIVECLAGDLDAARRPGDPPLLLEETCNLGGLRAFEQHDRELGGYLSELEREAFGAAGRGGALYTSGVRFARWAPVDPLESWSRLQLLRPHVRFLDRLQETERLRAEGTEVLLAFVEELAHLHSSRLPELNPSRTGTGP